MAHQVEFYRREMRSAWWEYFRLLDLEPNELMEEREGLEIQKLEGNIPFGGSGPFYVPVDHFGNQSQSKEEVE